MRALLVVPVAVLALAGVLHAAPMRQEAAGLRFAVPAEWPRVPAPSDVRAAQFRIPGAEGADAEVVLYFFGANRGGGVDDNLTRWYGQFTQPDGRSSKDVAVKTTRKVNGLDVTLVDLAGTYTGMGPDAGTKSGQRMLGAIVEGKGGPWFWKAVGPAATIEAAKPAFEQVVDSIEPHP